jgi:hypothetical protein
MHRFGHVNPIYIQVIREPLDRFVTYYYFLRCGDDHRPHLTRSRAGDNRVFLFVKIPFYFIVDI